MTKIRSLARILFPCFTIAPSVAPAAAALTTKRRLSTILLDDMPNSLSLSTTPIPSKPPQLSVSRPSTSAKDNVKSRVSAAAPPRPSKSMVTCTFYGARRSHVFFCVQLDRFSAKPALLLELSLSTHNLVKEMCSGLVRIALECKAEFLSLSLHSVPLWDVFCNGRRVGSAARRGPKEEDMLILKKMENMSVGAGVIPSPHPSGEDVMYMRANYEWIIGGADSQSFHLISPDDCPGQELSVFLLRSR